MYALRTVTLIAGCLFSEVNLITQHQLVADGTAKGGAGEAFVSSDMVN